MNLDNFKHNGRIYEKVDEYEWNNTIKMLDMETNDMKHYNLPIAYVESQKILIKDINKINFIDFLKDNLKLDYFSDDKDYIKVKFENLGINFKSWFLFIEKILNHHNMINHNIMKKYNIKINNSIIPTGFFIKEDDDGIIAPNKKKYILILHTTNSKYNPYDSKCFSKKMIEKICKNSIFNINDKKYKIIL